MFRTDATQKKLLKTKTIKFMKQKIIWILEFWMFELKVSELWFSEFVNRDFKNDQTMYVID